MSEEIQNINNEQTQITSEVPQSNEDNRNKGVFKFILIILAVFFGTFAAVYTIVDMCMYRLGLKPFFTIAKEFEKSFDDNIRDIEKSSPSPVKIEAKDNNYVVTLDLKSFGNNPENLEIKIENNGIKIVGQYKQDKKNSVKENNFYQNVIFPNKLKTEEVKKEIKHNKMLINIPFEAN